MKTYQVTLPDELATFVDRMLAEKKWDTLDDLMAAGVAQVQSDYEWEEDLTAGRTEELRKALQPAIEEADRGDVLDGEEVMARMRQRLEAARKQPT